MLDQGGGRDASPNWARRHLLPDTRVRKVKGNTARCVLLMKLLAVPDTNIFIVNIGLTKIKVTVIINLKWDKPDYPCYLVSRPHVTFPVTTKLYIP